MNDRDPAAAAEHDHRVELVRPEPGVGHQLARERGRDLDQVVDHSLEASPLERAEQVLGPAGVGPQEGQPDLEALRVGQGDLGLLGHVADARADQRVAAQVDLVGGLELLEEPVDDPLVEVDPADVDPAARADDLDAAAVEAEQRGVEAAGAEIEEQDRALARRLGLLFSFSLRFRLRLRLGIFARGARLVVVLVVVAGLLRIGLARLHEIELAREHRLEPEDPERRLALALERPPSQARGGGRVDQRRLGQPGDPQRVQQRAATRIVGPGRDHHQRALDRQREATLDPMGQVLQQHGDQARRGPAVVVELELHVAAATSADRDAPPDPALGQTGELGSHAEQAWAGLDHRARLGQHQAAGFVAQHDPRRLGVEADHDRHAMDVLAELGPVDHAWPTLDQEGRAQARGAEIQDQRGFGQRLMPRLARVRGDGARVHIPKQTGGRSLRARAGLSIGDLAEFGRIAGICRRSAQPERDHSTLCISPSVPSHSRDHA